MERYGTRPAWTLTQPAFERLLEALDADRDRAAVAYEQLRVRLIGLLKWWGAAHVEDLADATLDRVARKLEEGAIVTKGSLGAYVRGVARMVFHESAREPRLDPIAPSASDGVAARPAEDPEGAPACLDNCLAALTPDDRSLVLRYYGDGNKAEIRRRLAGDLNLSSTALRIRAHRVRERLEKCVTACMAKG